MSATPDRLQAMVDRQSIETVIARYYRAVDRLDQKLLESVFWPDAHFAGGPTDAPASVFLPHLLDGPRNSFEMSFHSIGNMLIELESEQAFGETYVTAYHKSKRSSESARFLLGDTLFKEYGEDVSRHYEMTLGLRYVDKFEKRHGEWCILERSLIVEWCRHCVANEIPMDGLGGIFALRGKRDRSDCIYQR